MGYNQINIVLNAVPIEEMLKDENLNDSIRYKLNLIQDVKTFAIDSLALKKSKNYESIYDQKGEVILWNLSACLPYEFKAITWSFPIIGEFPYKGFFNKEEAIENAKDLKEKAYDVRLRSVGAWSTLGWFNDPLLSNVLNRSDGDLINLILHEMTHESIFVKDSVQLSENIASFVGDEGAIYYLKNNFGEQSQQLKDYLQSENEHKIWVNSLSKMYDRLNDLYRNDLFKQFDKNKKDSLKYHIIDSIKNDFISNQIMDSTRSEIYKEIRINNAYIMSVKRYYSKQNEFQNSFKNEFNSNFKKYINHLGEKYN